MDDMFDNDNDYQQNTQTTMEDEKEVINATTITPTVQSKKGPNSINKLVPQNAGVKKSTKKIQVAPKMPLPTNTKTDDEKKNKDIDNEKEKSSDDSKSKPTKTPKKPEKVDESGTKNTDSQTENPEKTEKPSSTPAPKKNAPKMNTKKPLGRGVKKDVVNTAEKDNEKEDSVTKPHTKKNKYFNVWMHPVKYLKKKQHPNLLLSNEMAALVGGISYKMIVKIASLAQKESMKQKNVTLLERHVVSSAGLLLPTHYNNIYRFGKELPKFVRTRPEGNKNGTKLALDNIKNE